MFGASAFGCGSFATREATTYTYAASGGLTFAGSGPSVRIKVYAVSGGLQFAGSSATVKTKVYTPSGGLAFSGSAAIVKSKAFAPSGGLTLAGSAILAKSKAFTPAGGLSFAGSAALAKTKIFAAAGGVAFGGTATLSRIKAPSATGGVSFGGSSVTLFLGEHDYLGSGGLIFAGTAETLFTGLSASKPGSSRKRQRPSYGFLDLPAPSAATFAFVGSGGFKLFGTADSGLERRFVYRGEAKKRRMAGAAETRRFDTYAQARSEDEWLLAA